MDHHRATYWRLVWFFASSEADQTRLIGSTKEQWFIEEDAYNQGANYLIGVCLAFLEFSEFKPLGSEDSQALRMLIRHISENTDAGYWRLHCLFQTNEWREARIVSKRLLNSGTVWVQPPQSPFVIEEMIRTEHYLHASACRVKP